MIQHTSIFALTLVGMTAVPCTAQYVTGFTWNHGADHTNGTVPGSTTGNPDDDAAGNPAWEHLYFSGGSTRLSGNPWTNGTPSLLEWDDDYQGFGDVWVRDDDTSPILGGDYLQQDIYSTLQYTPAIRWTNPTGRTVTIEVSGYIEIAWDNWAGGDPSVNVDVVMFHDDVSAGTRTPILSTTVSTPGGGANAVVQISPTTFIAEPGDQLLYSHRAVAVRPNSNCKSFLEFTLRLACDAGDAGCICQRPKPDATPGPGAGDTQPSTTSAVHDVRAADNFSITTDRLLRRITWWGGRLNDTGPTDCVEPADFSVTVYTNAAGVPGTPVVGPLALTTSDLDEQESGIDVFRSGEKIDLLRHTHTLAQPVILPTGDYWLEIVDEVGSACYWSWLESDVGDGQALVDSGMNGYTTGETVGHDLAFCLELDSGVDIVAGGCGVDAAPTLSGPASSSEGFTINCAPSGISCFSAQVVIFGDCAAAPIVVPPPIGCAVCTLLVSPSYGTTGTPMSVGAGLAPGFAFCVQCGCIAQPAIGDPCVNLGPALTLIVDP